MKRKRQLIHRNPPADADIRSVAQRLLLRQLLDGFDRQAFAGQRLELDLTGCDLDPAESLLPGVTLQQVIAKGIATGSTINGLAGGLMLPLCVIEGAVKDLARGCVVDWTPAPRKKVA